MTNERYVLIVEDDPFYGRLYETAAEKEGLKIVVAENSEKAFQKIHEAKPGLIVLDLIIAGKDGFQILTELKKDPELNAIKVIMLSNVSGAEEQQKAKTLGAADYLVKSNLSFEEMIEKIRAHLN